MITAVVISLNTSRNISAIVDFQKTTKKVNNDRGFLFEMVVYHLNFAENTHVLRMLHQLSAHDAFNMRVLSLNLSLNGCKITDKTATGISLIALQEIEEPKQLEDWLPKMKISFEASMS